MLDMNAAYDLQECIDFAHAVEPHRIFWLEEPLHWYLQPADFARLAAATPIPIAHGERELTRFTVRDFIVEGGIRFVQFDATRAAGFTEALRIAALAEQHGAIVAPHTAPELHGHLVLALPRCAFGVESHGGPETDPLAFGLFHEHPELRDGHLIFGDKPGFGLDIDWGFVDRYRISAGKLEAAHQSDEAPLNLHAIGSEDAGLIGLIGGFQGDRGAAAAQPFQGDLLIVDQRDDDATVFRRVAALNDHCVTIENAGLYHAVAGHLERVMLAVAAEQAGRHPDRRTLVA